MTWYAAVVGTAVMVAFALVAATVEMMMDTMRRRHAREDERGPLGS